jgi:WD40 repeat protein
MVTKWVLPFSGNYAVFSPDGTQVVSHYQTTAVVRNSSSGEIVAKFHMAPDEYDRYLCFSPNGRLVVATAGSTVYVWDITGSEPHLIETFIGHSGAIVSSYFPHLLFYLSIP